MKKAFKIIAIILGTALLILGLIALYIQLTGIPHYDVEPFDFQHQSSPEAIARGKKLVLTLCAGCHRNPKTRKLTGAQMLDAPKEFGVIFSKNITQDKQFGIGDWTDAELVYLIRTGIKPDGQYIPPYMAKLPHLADSDMNAIIAFLRSGDPEVAADPTPDKFSKPSFLSKLLSHIAFKPMPMPEGPIALPDSSDQLALGRYLAWNLDCFSCHSADFKTNDFAQPDKSVGYFGGGNQTLNKEGQIIPTANLTSHATGIGNMSKTQFIQAVKYGLKEGEPALRYPMAPYTLLADHEVSAIYHYLQTIPPIENEVERKFYD